MFGSSFLKLLFRTVFENLENFEFSDLRGKKKTKHVLLVLVFKNIKQFSGTSKRAKSNTSSSYFGECIFFVIHCYI